MNAFHAVLTSVVATSNDGDGEHAFSLEQARDVARDARWRVRAEAGAYAGAQEGDDARAAGGCGRGRESRDRVDVERFVECIAQLTKSDLHTLARRTADAASLGGLVAIAADADSVVETMLRALDPFDRSVVHFCFSVLVLASLLLLFAHPPLFFCLLPVFFCSPRVLYPFDSADEGLVSHLEVRAVLQRCGVPLTWAETVMLCIEFKAPPGTRRSAHSAHRLRVQYERLVAALFG